MRYFFAMRFAGRLSLDGHYLSCHRIALLVRNLVAVVLYGLVVTRLQHDNPYLAAVLVVLAACHALMIGIVLGRSSDEC